MAVDRRYKFHSVYYSVAYPSQPNETCPVDLLPLHPIRWTRMEWSGDRKKNEISYEIRKIRDAEVLRKVGAAFAKYSSKANMQTTFAMFKPRDQRFAITIWIHHYTQEKRDAYFTRRRRKKHILPERCIGSQNCIGNDQTAQIQFARLSLPFSKFKTLTILPFAHPKTFV